MTTISGNGTPKVFVANRGEIAFRVIQSAHALGMETVLGVSAADRDGRCAREAGEVVVLGPAPARDSYLRPDLIVHAALATECTALHPGYGFLSERPELAELCRKEGIAFVGPSAEAIRKVGDKLSARAMAKEAGIPMTCGSDAVHSVEEALETSDSLGYPVITKASAGGGGRGMLVARNADELARGFDEAATIAREAFGDGTLFIERFVEEARHLEVQVFGDGKGGAIHFGERDCSIQRRYQKMLEEAPASVLSKATRERLRAAAVKLLGSIGYRNAGTVEFLYDVKNDEFFFMEVNARIQVEHPVSEMITGSDLIGKQLAFATGSVEKLDQSEVSFRGHAIEVRIIAEDPRDGFMPSPGRITAWVPPTGPGVRVDTAMESGALVPPFYDSMIAKLIVHGNDRASAVERLRRALDQFRIEGIATNIPLLRYIVSHDDFLENRISTRWLETVLLPSFQEEQGR